MSEEPVNREPGPSSFKGFMRLMKNTFIKPQVEVAKEGFKQAAKEFAGFVKETLITSGEAFAASGRVLAKDIQEFAGSLGIHLPEQGPIPPKDRIITTAISAIGPTFFLGMASFISYETLTAQHPTPGVLLIAGGLALIHAIPGTVFLKETYDIAMGKKMFPGDPVMKN